VRLGLDRLLARGTTAAARQDPAVPVEERGEKALSESVFAMLLSLASFPDDRPKHRLTVDEADEMERRDDMVRAALALKRAARLATGHDIQPASKDPTDVEIAGFVRYVFGHMQGSVNEALNATMLAFSRGFSVLEKVWSEPYASGPYAGRIGYARLKPKAPGRLYFKTDVYGNLLPDGLWQERDPLGRSGGEGSRDLYLRLPVSKFFIYSHDKRDDNYYGESDLRAAWRAYLLKNDVYPAWKDFMVRFGAPLLIASLRKTTLTSGQRAKVLSFLERLRRGTNAVLPPGVEIEDLASKISQAHTTTYEEAIKTCDRAIARSILVPSLILDEGERSGSLALGRSHAATFLSVLDHEGEILSDLFLEQIIRPLVDLNYAGVDNYPRLVFRPFAERDLKPVAEMIELLVRAGYKPSEAWVFEQFGIPIEEQGTVEDDDEGDGGDLEPGPDDDGEGDGEDEALEAGSDPGRAVVSLSGAASRYWRRPTEYEEKVDFAGLEVIEAAELEATAAAVVDLVSAMREEVVARLGKVRPSPRDRSSPSASRPPSSETSGASSPPSTSPPTLTGL
jgi:hypothetical protein